MLKELILIPRTLWSLASTFLFAIWLPFPVTPLKGLVIFALIFGFSFGWQYILHYYAMKQMQSIRNRRIYMLVWLLISPVVVLWGIISIANVDYTQGVEVALSQFAWASAIFVAGASLLVGSTCTRRAFERHKAL